MPTEQLFFDQIFRATRRKGRRINLVKQHLPEKCHRPIHMMQSMVDSGNCIIAAPLIAGPVGTGNEQPVQDREENSPLNIELKLPVGKQIFENRRQTQFLPESLENQSRADLDRMSIDIDFAGKNEQSLFRKSGQGADKSFNVPLGLELIETANRGEYTLADFTADLAVLDDLQILILAGLFDSCKHWALLC